MVEFLTLNPTSFGVDVSDLSLKITKLKKTKKGFDLASWGETKIKPGVIEIGEIKDEESLSQTIKKAITEVKGERLKTKYAVISLPEEKSFMQVIQMPKMSEEELKNSIYYEAENYIPLPVDKVYLGFQVIEPIENHLDHLDVLITALPKEIIDPYVRSFKKAGLQPKVLELESQAVVRALIKDSVSFTPLLLVDIGENRTSFIIFSGRSLRFTFSLPVSSERMTQAISTKLNIDFSEADKLKMNYNLKEKDKDANSKKIFEAIEPVLMEITNQAEKYIDFYRTHSFHEHLPPPEDSGDIKKIIICGGGANLKGLSDFFQQKTGILTEVSDPLINISSDSKTFGKKLGFSFKKSLSFTTAIGLALRGFKKENYD